jgi:hypothetical protein
MSFLIPSRLEAALNAAVEALNELREIAGITGVMFDIGTTPRGEPKVTIEHKNGSYRYLFGSGTTGAEAMRDALAKLETARAEPVKLETAKEVLEAVQALDIPAELRAQIDALPVA